MSFQSTAYQQLALVAVRHPAGAALQRRDPEAVQARAAPVRVDRLTPIASKRSVRRVDARRCVGARLRRGHGARPSAHAAWRCLASRSAVPRRAAGAPARRVLTSQKTSVAASQTTRSSSPKRVRWLRATSAKPRRSRCSSGEVARRGGRGAWRGSVDMAGDARRPRAPRDARDRADSARLCAVGDCATPCAAVTMSARSRGAPCTRRPSVAGHARPRRPRSPSTASSRAASRSRSTSAPACPRSRSSASPTAPCARRASACARRC